MEEDYIINNNNDSPNTTFLRRNRCCFHFPCFGSGPTSSILDPVPDSKSRWWARPFWAFREWSEIVAGPKWKTFIRRFNRRRYNNHHHHQPGKFQYDPLSYALNFDEGQGLNSHFDEDVEVAFTVVPLNSSSSVS